MLIRLLPEHERLFNSLRPERFNFVNWLLSAYKISKPREEGNTIESRLLFSQNKDFSELREVITILPESDLSEIESEVTRLGLIRLQ